MPRPKSERPTYSLAKRADVGGVFYVQWWEGGRSRRVSCRTADPREARRFLAEFQVGLVATPPPRSPTIGAVLDGYLADRLSAVHSQTIKYCVAALKAHLADLPVDLLTKDVVRGYIRDRRKAGAQGASARHRTIVRPLSDGTLIRELGTLRAGLAWAVRERWINHAPHVERPSAPQPRERWLTHDDAEKLLAAADAAHIKAFIALALYTAARAGALLQLTWDRVDLKRGTINLGESRGRKKRATVPIVDDLRAVLTPAAEAATSPFVIEYGGRPVASIKTGFRAAVRRAELSGVTPHVLRHTAATWMVQRNVPIGMIAAWLGNSEEMIRSVYGHHSPEWLKQAAAAFSRPSGRGNT
jgi:integrase